MAATGVIGMHEPWIDDDGVDVLLPAVGPGVAGFLARNRADVVLALMVMLSAVVAGLAARLLCGV